MPRFEVLIDQSRRLLVTVEAPDKEEAKTQAKEIVFEPWHPAVEVDSGFDMTILEAALIPQGTVGD